MGTTAGVWVAACNQITRLTTATASWPLFDILDARVRVGITAWLPTAAWQAAIFTAPQDRGTVGSA